MQLEKFPFSDTHSFSSFFLDYIDQKETLKPFYNRFPHLENFSDQIRHKQDTFPVATRKIVADVVKQQYGNIEASPAVEANIELLKNEKTFTITTGHQLNIFTGPLYFIYKIVTVINTAKRLGERFPEYKFVPVYWMASEDHDYDEIKYFRLYGKKYEWKTNQSGAVGRFRPNGLAALIDEVPGDVGIFREAYGQSKTLSEAVRHYVNALFGAEGLIVIDPDDALLKGEIRNVIREDVLDNAYKPLVDETNSRLHDLGYKTQVYCREINFFYLENNIRGRLEFSGDAFKVVDTDLSYSREEMASLIETNPERFSPNVVLRPLYQELILPNLAYIGGPAEVIYWLQLKAVFDKCDVPYPILMPRNFAMIVDHEVARKLSKTGLDLKDIFEEKNYLFNHWVLKHSPRNLTVGTERGSINGIFQQLRDRAEQVDKSLSPFVGAEGKRALNSLEKIERKLLRAEKRLHSDKLRQIAFVKDALFPNGSPQERTDNFLNFYQQDRDFVGRLLHAFDPFDFRFNVLMI
jgi:bacillithiol synthase